MVRPLPMRICLIAFSLTMARPLQITGVQSLGQPRMAILPSWIMEVVMTLWLTQTDF